MKWGSWCGSAKHIRSAHQGLLPSLQSSPSKLRWIRGPAVERNGENAQASDLDAGSTATSCMTLGKSLVLSKSFLLIVEREYPAHKLLWGLEII